MNTLIKGPTGSGKTKYLKDTYQKLIDGGVRTDRILVLLRNRRQSILWRNVLQFKRASGIKIQSFFGFIQGEIKKYWPLISTEIDGFKPGMNEPVFITSEVSQYLITKFAEDMRTNGKLLDITASSTKIAIETLGNLSRAVTAGIDTIVIGARLLDSLLIKNASKERLYKELQELVDYYRKFCCDNGYIDYSLSIEIFNKSLLQSEEYILRLAKEIEYLLVDGLEDAVAFEIDFIGLMLKKVKEAYLTISTDDSYSRRQGACPAYAMDMIASKCSKAIEFHKSEICDEQFMALSEKVFHDILEYHEESTSSFETKIQSDNVLNIQAELRSEMIKKINEELDNLLAKGYDSKDIAVICPMVDSVLEYSLKSHIEKKGIGVSNIARTSKYIEESFPRALITLACLAHPKWDINPPEHDIANLMGMVLGLDPVRSSLISSEVVKQKPFTLPELESLEFRERIGFKSSDKYNMLKKWIEDYRKEEPVAIDVFFQSAFVTIMLRVPRVEEHINSCRLLIESASNFIKSMEVMPKEDWGRKFVRMVKEGIKPAETIQDLEDKLYTEDIILSTPQAYLASSMSRKIQVWTDVSSSFWYRSDVEEMANPYVFSPIWQESKPWTENLDDEYRMLKCGVLVRALIRKCPEKVYLAESAYNQDGYENDGILREVL